MLVDIQNTALCINFRSKPRQSGRRLVISPLQIYYMKKSALIFSFLISFLGTICAQETRHTLVSPSKNIKITAGLDKSGKPFYEAVFNNKKAINRSYLGFKCKEGDFSQNLQIVETGTSKHDETWKTVWGEVAEIRDRYKQLELLCKNSDGRMMKIVFRAFDDGIAFRYDFPNQGVNTLTFQEEMSEFAMAGDHTAWWIPGDYDSNEHVYTKSKISQINAKGYRAEQSIVTQHIIDDYLVQTPITMRASDGTHFSIVEAALVDFAALHLRVFPKGLKFKASLIPSADSTVLSVNAPPFHTPWRGVIIAKDAAGILESKMILNLNEPCKIDDVSWIKPQKYVGVWWEMHVGKATWDYAASQDMNSATGRQPHGRHGANTANVKRYIDFAAKYGFDGVLVEGWNEGWEDWFNKLKEEVFDFTKPYPDYDIEELTRYAKEKGVRIIAHHETSSAVGSYERQMEAAYNFMEKYHMNSVKTGYVGKILPLGEWHDGQKMVNHYIRVAQATAKHKIMLDAHEPVRPSGLHRTWPNWMACEAARGQEFNAWSRGNPPEHECILPFTRILGGPMDYTPGIFEVRMNAYDPKKTEVVHTTVAKQLALYVTLYSPLQMAADLPENYEKRLDVFQFIRDVPVDWDDTKILNAAVGDYMTVARRQKGTKNWFLGSITNDAPRKFDLKLDFLEKGKSYEATIYEDGPKAHWKGNPYPVSIRKITVKKGDPFKLALAAGGGCAVSFIEK